MGTRGISFFGILITNNDDKPGQRGGAMDLGIEWQRNGTERNGRENL
jgi:hypothetical protein